jgi:tetratricopeptide (TPR) repeat protein
MARLPPHKTEPDSSRITRLRIAPVAARCLAALLLVGEAPVVSHAQSAPATACADWGAELSAIEGTVQVQRGENGAWSRVAHSDVLCFGDSVRAHAFSRVVVRMRDQSVIRLDEHSTLTLTRPDDGIGSLIELIRGVIHVISRDPRALRFSTPYANAGLEGTEFDIRVAEDERRTEIAVLEGEVVVTTPLGRIDVPGGYVGSAREGEMPVARAIVEPIELMRWASYFPEIIDADLPAPDQEPQGIQARDATFFAARAAARLRRGNLETAEADIATTLRLAPGDATALALQAIVATARNDSRSARERAYAATAATPPTAAAFIALSYVLQADWDLDEALASLTSAIAVEPENAIAWARRAEVELGRGQWDRSVESATRAVALRPTLGYARAVLGFVRLSAGDVARAVEAFEEAAQLDQGAPLPHIGLALALIQRGDFVAGRQQLEVAVALDPGNALTRSYMAKTYDAENRRQLPATQLALAKRFDPNDPTPWLYDALLKLHRNRPVEALQDLLGAISRNDNRALFRSRLAMDADLATRSAGTGRVLRELGFEQLALVRGWAATAVDPTDYAAHRLLADVQSVTARNEISRVSELLTSQLLQPANLTPIQPQLGQASPLLVTRIVPSELAFTELAPLVTENGLRFQASTVAGANDTFGEDVVLAGLRDRLSYSFGQFRFSTDGVRENNSFDQTIANAFVQFNPNERTSLQAELRTSEVERGDLARYFDRARYSNALRVEENVDRLRLGGRRNFGAHDTLLVSLSTQDSDAFVDVGDFSVSATDNSNGVDVQHIHEAARWNLRTGAFWAHRDQRELSNFGGVAARDTVLRQRSAYAYADIALSRSVTVTAGASADAVGGTHIEKDRLDPKIGVSWVPTDKVTVRAASFQTLQGTLTTSKQNPQPRLEPVHVAGFNQFLFGTNGDESTVNGFAVDGEVSANMFVGAELLARTVHGVALFLGPGSDPFTLPTEATEDIARTYLYWTPRRDLAFSVQYQAERLSADALTPLGFTNVRTRRLPIEARYFSANGFSAGLRASRFAQHGEFLFREPTGPDRLAHGADRFWIVDAFAGFRLPNRRGVLSFNVDNLLDEDFRFQDLDPENPSIMPERMAYFRFTLSFD